MISLLELINSIEIGLIYSLATLGIYLTFRVINFSDLTCDGSFIVGAAVSSTALTYLGYSPLLSLFLGACAASFAGFFTSILYLYFKVPDLLSGILTAFMLYSVNLRIMQGIPNITLTSEITIFDQFHTLSFLLIVVFLSWGVLSYLFATEWGLALQSVGQNKFLSEIKGVCIPYFTIIGLMMSHFCVGLSGALFSQHQRFVDISQGVGTIIVSLAALLLGETLFNFKSLPLKLLSCVFGSILYRIIISIALNSEWIGLNSSDLNLITGAIIIILIMINSKKSFLSPQKA